MPRNIHSTESNWSNHAPRDTALSFALRDTALYFGSSFGSSDCMSSGLVRWWKSVVAFLLLIKRKVTNARKATVASTISSHTGAVTNVARRRLGS